jgi:hypothetical protein
MSAEGDESEQEYYVIYRPDEVPQNNTHSDAHHVDSDQARTINFTDDGHVEVDRGQVTSFVEDALPSADMNVVAILELWVQLPIPQVMCP